MSLLRCRSAIAATIFALATLAPAASRADDSVRIRNLESEIQLLRTQVAEQDRRIQRLEAQLEQRGSAIVRDPGSVLRAEIPATGQPRATGPLPWHSREAWEGIAIGMSQEEVTTILGEPTAVEAMEGYKTLFYGDAMAPGGAINAHVNFRDDRVVAIRKPAP